MSKSKKEIPSWAKAGHGKPVTRREFLAHGLIPFAAATFMPNWMKFLSPEYSSAQANCPAGGSNMIPFIQLNLEGGAGLAANFVPMNAQRQVLNSYNIIGLGSNQIAIERAFNNAPFAGNGVSNVLTGLRSAIAAQTEANTAFLGLCVQSRDDSSENYFAVNGLVHRAGLVGSRLPHLGDKDSRSGINQLPAVFSPPSPLVVRNFASVANSMAYTASLAGLTQPQKERLSRLVADLNGSQARKLAAVNNGAQMQDLLNCAGVKNQQLIREGAAAVDPRTNAQVSQIWGGINANTGQGDQNLVFGTMVFNTILGNAGSASLSIGGYDYHNNDRATVTNVRDRNAGVVMGRILETARVLNRPVVLMVTTDGAVSATQSETPNSDFNSDRGSAGMVYMFMYNPAGRPVTTDFQVGHYTNGQSADTAFVIGGNPELAAQAVFLNWLRLNNRMDLYNTVVPQGRSMDAAQVAQVVKVG